MPSTPTASRRGRYEAVLQAGEDSHLLTCLVLAAVLLASIIIGIGTGPVAHPTAEVWRVMFHRLGGLLTGSGSPLEGVRGEHPEHRLVPAGPRRCCWGPWWGRPSPLSGVGMQAFTKNPLAEPYVLGISSGASLGAVLAMLLGCPCLCWAACRCPPAPLPGLWCPSSWCSFWPHPEMR